MTNNTRPKALRLAEELEHDPGINRPSVVAELRRIAELESQIEAIGAGGVEPLRRRECLHQIAEPAPAREYPALPDPDASTVGHGHMWNRHSMRAYVDAYRAMRAHAAPAAVAGPSDDEILALNAGEIHFSESPSKYPWAGHGTQYHAGAPGVLSFARAVLARWGAAPTTQAAHAAQGDAEDAARYRWLKSQASEKLLNPRAALSEICADMRTHWKLPTLICSGPVGGYLDFDASIDAAREQGANHD